MPEDKDKRGHVVRVLAYLDGDIQKWYHKNGGSGMTIIITRQKQ